MKALRIGLISLVLAVGCGGASSQPGVLFKKNWQSDGGVSIAKVEERLRGVARVKDANVAVGVTKKGLVAEDLGSKARWSYAGKVDGLPSIAGDLVVFTSGNDVVALNAKNGRPVWTISAEGRKLRGAGDDGSLTVLSLGSAEPGKSRLVVVNRSGSAVLDVEPGVELGRPAIVGGVAFVPWGDQYVSAIDVSSKEEIGRLLLRDLVSHALLSDAELWFGEKALVRFDDRIRLADNQDATRVSFQTRELPGYPRWLSSGIELADIDDTARTKIRVYATPTSAGGKPHFANQTYMATYFRVAYGLATTDGKLLWARALGGDSLGGAVARSGFVLCDAGGTITKLDAQGGLTAETALGEPLSACVVQGSSLDVAPGKPAGSLAQQLAGSLEALETNMAAAQSFLLAELAKHDEALVTKALIDLSSSERLPPSQRLEARKLLSSRRKGAEHMLAALERHYDFVSGTLPPPVGPIADALAALNETRGAPLLARHLNDPANSIDDVERAARALGKLATPAEFRDLRTFFALYRATADEPGLVKAVSAVAGALLRVGAEEGRALVERAASDPLTQPDVRKAISSLTPPPNPEPRAAEAK